ncbi:signal peptide peptidase SppA [Conservatibacter flavescens]|uniref:Signal peptide peptidase SppA n=1 Tax=Conservatibacter flavescens TaxID=28161 RepID=A0A2M8S5U0_9PAST|nr:signal peptide peptidase SppA [Conservatibacter flavescens]PJG86473.1 signal peptide peptidase SppA [Conservatibacter flavescens]
MKTLVSIVKCLWRGLNCIRDVVMNIVFLLFVLLAFTVFGLMSGVNRDQSLMLTGEQGALYLNLEGYLTDNREEMDWRTALKGINGYPVSRQYSVFDVVYVIEQAAKDERIQGLVMDLNYFEGADLATIRYIGNAIAYFKTQNKPVIAYADYYGQSQYLLASFADEIYMNKVGQVDIHGFAVQNLYFKSLLEKLDVTAHVFRVGSYKSAVEPFLRDDMSPEARQNTAQWLGKMWQSYQETIAQNRNIPLPQVLPNSTQYLAELKTLKGDQNAYTIQRGLVNQAVTKLEFEQKLMNVFGANQSGSFKSVDYDTYLAALPDRMLGEGEKIAVVNVEGAIIDGESMDGNVGGDTISRLLRIARDDNAVKAVILRVNSPGGSAFASELIRQEVDNLQAANKPVIVSMGNMAASGGYWIASTADYIIADSNTLTGSIGIFGMFPTFENTIKKAGVYSDEVATSPLSQGSSITALSNEVSETIQLSIEHGYTQFLSIVSQGRGLTIAEVDSVAQGRVWLGEEAYQHKLVDEIGDFSTAVRKAKELSGHEELSLEWVVDSKGSLWQSLLNDFNQGTKTTIQHAIAEFIGIPSQTYQQIKQQAGILTQYNDPKGQYLYCLTCSIVK